MDDISDLKKDLSAIKTVTDEEGRIKAWIDNVDLKKDKIKIVINTALGEEIVETFKNPKIWSEEYAFVNLINKSDIDLRLINSIYDLEIRYDPETEEIVTIGSQETVSEINITDKVYELEKLRERTISDNWIRCSIKDVKINEKVNINIHLPNTGKITFKYDIPDSWDNNEYAVVQLCDRLGVNSANQLIGYEVAVSPKEKSEIDIRHTPFHNPLYSIDSNIPENEDNTYTLIPISYLNGDIPEKEVDNNTKVSNEGNLSAVILEAFLFIVIISMFMLLMGSILDGLSEGITNPDADIIVNENQESISIILEDADEHSVTVIENGNKVGILDEDELKYKYKPNNKSGTIQLILNERTNASEDKTEVLSKVSYNFKDNE